MSPLAIAVALGLRETDAIDDRGMIEAVGNDRILFAEQRLENTAIGVEARRHKEFNPRAEIVGDLGLELAMQIGRTADEAHRGHTQALVSIAPSPL